MLNPKDINLYTEVVEVQYDPQIITLQDLLAIFWKEHDPTSKDRQGPDQGVQYRSVIFYFSLEQKKEADQSALQLQQILGRPVVTEIRQAKTFFRAEEYHQDYLTKQGKNSCFI